jgi:hypothetical protein
MSAKRQRSAEWLLARPFGEQLFVGLLLVCITPPVYAAYLAAVRNWFRAVIVLIVWGPAFAILVWWLSRQGLVRLWVSLGGVLVVVSATVLVLLAR